MKIYTLTKLVKFGSAYEIANEICKINNCFDHVKDIADTIQNEHGFDVTICGQPYTVTEYVSEEEVDNED